MFDSNGHILTDDVVIDYKKSDRDDCLHFLTHLDTTCKDLSLFISPTAKRIYTSVFNAWFLKMNFDVKHIEVQGFCTNKSYKITYKGNKYIYSFVESKFTTGSVALLLHGSFGTYLYTGNFCYYPSFLRSPVILPVIEEKALTRLYLDNTYYEQPSNFLGFHELTTKVAALIKSQPMKNFYIYADKVTMDPLLADIASKLEEKVYVCQSTMEIMKILGYESCFTRHSNESRIFIDKAFIKKRGFGLENIAIYINRYSESCKTFQKIEKKGNVYTFNFYCHSNHKEICELLRILKPESMTFLFSEIDKSKLSYDFKFKYDFPRNVLFNGILTEPSIKVESETDMLVQNIPKQLIKPSITIDKVVNQYSGNESKNLVQSTSENCSVTNLSKEYVCPLRIRKVPEINNTGLSNGLNSIIEGGTENVTCNKLSYIGSNEINNSDRNTNFSTQSYVSVKDFHNYHKPQQNNSVGFIKLANYDSTENTLISSNIKSLSSCVVKTKTGVPLVFNSRLVKENRLTRTNPKVMQISNIGVASDDNKNTIVLNRKYVSVKKPCVVTVPANGIQKTKPSDIENGKHNATKKSLMLLKSKTTDSDSSMKRPNALLQPHSNVLDLTKLFHGWMDNDMTSIPNNSSQTSETSQNIIDEHEESISVVSHNCDRNSVQLKSPRNNTTYENKNSDSLEDNLQNECDIDQSSETFAEFHLQSSQQTCNEKNSGSDESIATTVDKSVVNNRATSDSPCKSTKDSRLGPLNANTVENNKSEFCKNNFQVATNDASNTTSKRHLSDDENGQLRKKLRSDDLRQCLTLQSSWQQKEPLSIRNCMILVIRNSFEKSYFYSSKHNCYLPKFYGFKKHEVRPRHLLNNLRNLQKLIMEINYN